MAKTGKKAQTKHSQRAWAIVLSTALMGTRLAVTRRLGNITTFFPAIFRTKHEASAWARDRFAKPRIVKVEIREL